MKSAIATVILLFAAGTLLAQPKKAANYGPLPTPLYAAGAPGAKGEGEAHQPTVRAYLPDEDEANGAAVVICPGGGYRGLAIDHEGQQIARFFNEFGVAAFVLRYRLSPDYRHPTQLHDAQRAVQHVRANAAEYRIDPERVGIMGFSAGGHLASSLATHWHRGRADSADPIARQSCRPDFAILGYPVVTFTEEEHMHGGSRRSLLGDEPDPKLVELMSNEKQVNAETPPTFMFHTGEDRGVPPENSVLFYLALRQAGVPAEIHVYQKGQHGLGLAPGDPTLSSWGSRLKDWLRNNGWLTDQPRLPLTGEVTVYGDPITRGWVTFTPLNNPHAPAISGYLRNSKIRIAQADGPIPGKYSVTITILSQARALVPTIETTREITGLSAAITSDTKTLDFHIPAPRQFPIKKPWGTIELGLGQLELKVTELPPNRKLDIPRLNNRIGAVYLAADKDRKPLRFWPEIKDWQITLPKNAKAPLTAIVEIKDNATYDPAISGPRRVHPNPDGTIDLHAFDSITHGRLLRFEPQPHKNTVGYWVDENDWCEWYLNVSERKTYSVHIWQGCGTDQGGSNVRMSVGQEHLDFKVEDTGHFQNFKHREIGTITIVPGNHTLKLKPLKKANKAVGDFRRIKLVPVRQ